MSDVFTNLVQASSERRDEKEFNTEIVEEFAPAEFPEFVREPKSPRRISKVWYVFVSVAVLSSRNLPVVSLST